MQVKRNKRKVQKKRHLKIGNRKEPCILGDGDAAVALGLCSNDYRKAKRLGFLPPFSTFEKWAIKQDGRSGGLKKLAEAAKVRRKKIGSAIKKRGSKRTQKGQRRKAA